MQPTHPENKALAQQIATLDLTDLSAFNSALQAIELAHADGLTAMQVCVLVDAASGVPIRVARERVEAAFTRDGVGRPDIEVRNLTFEQIRQTLADAAGKVSASKGRRLSGVAPVEGQNERRSPLLLVLRGRVWAVELRARTGLAHSAQGLPEAPTGGELAILGMHLVRRAVAAMTAQATSGLRARWCRAATALLKGRRP